VPYKATDDLPTPADYGRMVAEVAGDWGVTLMFEPGRVITGNSGGEFGAVGAIQIESPRAGRGATPCGCPSRP
jgi:diaminopimelate decarboxylase